MKLYKREYNKYIKGQMTPKEQINFIQTVIDLDLDEEIYPELRQTAIYFIREGMCYEVVA
jgi:hypothetical protein